jgi:hypothetical protein
MKTVVQARLDPDTGKMLSRLTTHLGWSESEVVRAGLRLLDASYPAPPTSRIIGLGKFTSGVPDLGTNKAHLKGFGR